jgi:VNT family MFS transporter (synaptic vesicle glycoprotein 2)
MALAASDEPQYGILSSNEENSDHQNSGQSPCATPPSRQSSSCTTPLTYEEREKLRIEFMSNINIAIDSVVYPSWGGAYPTSLGIANAADAAEIVCLGFIMNEIDDELDAEQKSLLSSAVFMGMLVGGLGWGSISDAIGRRSALSMSLWLNTVAGGLSGIAPNINILIILRMFAGIGIGGSVPCLYALGGEIFPVSQRGSLLSIVSAFWMVGAIWTAIVAWVMLGIWHTGWRPYAVASILPSFVALLCTHFVLPESPVLLEKKGKYTEALAEVKKITGIEIQIPHLLKVESETAQKSGSSSRMAFTASVISPMMLPAAVGSNSSGYDVVKSDENIDTEAKGDFDGSNGEQGADEDTDGVRGVEEGGHDGAANGQSEILAERQKCGSRVALIVKSIVTLFDEQNIRKTLILLLIWFTLSFGTYGISTWISTLFDDCGIRDVYLNSLIFSTATIPGNLFTVYAMDMVGRSNMLMYGIALGAVSLLGFALDTSSAAMVVTFSSLFNMFSIAGWNALDVVTTELFPVNIRGMSLGIMGACGRVGSIAAQFANGQLESNIPLLLCVTTGCMLVGAFSVKLLKEPI